MEVGQGVEAALGSAGHVLEAARLQPAVADGVIRGLATQQPIDIGQADDAGIWEEFGHGEVCVGFRVSNALILADSEMGLNRTADDKADRAFLFGAGIAEGFYQMWFKAN